MKPADDGIGAFMPGPRLQQAGAAVGPLAGRRFAVKDLFDVAGDVTGYGNPDWARTHAPAAATAPAIRALLEAGASLDGKTKTMELAYGLTGENEWYGTPVNPAAPDRFPGGSSCGSAAAVAAGQVDFALGSDTGGSVRIPSSYCGVFGIRPSWGAISLAGACALAPSFDTLGWFARDIGLLGQVGDVLLPPDGGVLQGLLLKAADAWANADAAVADVLQPALAAAEAVLGRAGSVTLAPEGLAAWYEGFRCMQAEEAWAALGTWVAAEKPAFSAGVAQRFAMAAALPAADAAAGRALRRQVQARLAALLAGGAILVYPTSPQPAPRVDTPPAVLGPVRERTMAVTAIAGLGGLPEVTLPAGLVEGAPVGLSLVAGRGRDRALLAVAAQVAARLGDAA